MERCCPNCKRPYSRGWLKDMRKRQSENIKSALARAKANGDPVGRPRAILYDDVYKLRESGLSIAATARTLGCSIGSVQHALRKIK